MAPNQKTIRKVLVTSMAPNPLNEKGLETSMAPNPLNEKGLVTSLAPNTLNEKGLVSWIRKCTTDRITGDLWKVKAKHIKPVNLAKEMVAAISDDQERIAAALEKVSELFATKKVMIRSGGRPGQCSYKCSGPIRDRS